MLRNIPYIGTIDLRLPLSPERPCLLTRQEAARRALPERGADAMTVEASGEIYFPVIVETATSTLSRGSQTLEIKPGMVASVDILTGERTVLDYLLKPLRKAQAEALRER